VLLDREIQVLGCVLQVLLGMCLISKQLLSAFATHWLFHPFETKAPFDHKKSEQGKEVDLSKKTHLLSSAMGAVSLLPLCTH
jgi:hypothetical protein